MKILSQRLREADEKRIEVLQEELKHEREALNYERKVIYHYKHLVYKSPKMQEVVKRIDSIADKDTPILIIGETGSGKEVIVNEIHKRGNRSERQIVSVNCSAIAENLIESELFGHEKGAFTGAVGSKEGIFEFANGGTVFLDEIADLPLNSQAKLLRVLEERKFYRVGGNKEIEVDVRIISATNKDLRN
jgi:transcriptional regulator with GAF, ATPase, and Fis domain